MKLFIQMGSRRSEEFGKIPSVFDYAKTEEDDAILQFHFGQLLLGRPLAGPPGIPTDRLNALRDALSSVAKDPQFLAMRRMPASTLTRRRPMRRWHSYTRSRLTRLNYWSRPGRRWGGDWHGATGRFSPPKTLQIGSTFPLPAHRVRLG